VIVLILAPDQADLNSRSDRFKPAAAVCLPPDPFNQAFQTLESKAAISFRAVLDVAL
jgi:hypothetical protein